MSPSLPGLTAERIVATAEEIVRRHGAAKANVVDVAQELGVSHGNIYRFFPTKAALREAVVELWLQRIVEAQARLVLEGSATERLRTWFWAFFELKRNQHRSDPQLFEAYRQLAAEARASVEAYKGRLVGLLAPLVARGMANGELCAGDAPAVSRTLLNALTKFHHPSFAAAWEDPGLVAEFAPLWAVVARGISLERTIS